MKYPTTTFIWKGMEWSVKFIDGCTLYRETLHLGGPWSNVVDTLKNPSIDLSFRKLLAQAEKKLLDSARS